MNTNIQLLLLQVKKLFKLSVRNMSIVLSKF